MAVNPYHETSRMPPLPQQGVFRILFIDDHEDTSAFIQTFLERTSRYIVISAFTGAEGLELAAREHFDLVMLDAWLPDLSGLDLCRQLRESNPAIPILFYSAAAYASDIEAGLAAGAQAYMVKPADLDQLELTIRELVEQASRPTEE